MSSSDDLPPQTLTEIEGLLRQGQKISAIKVFRDATGVGLAEAKAAVERMELGLPAGAGPAADAAAKLTPQMVSELEHLIVEGRKIEAIKVYRETTGCSLAESKAAMDDLERDVGARGRGPYDPENQSKAFHIFACVALLVIGGAAAILFSG